MVNGLIVHTVIYSADARETAHLQRFESLIGIEAFLSQSQEHNYRRCAA